MGTLAFIKRIEAQGFYTVIYGTASLSCMKICTKISRYLVKFLVLHSLDDLYMCSWNPKLVES